MIDPKISKPQLFTLGVALSKKFLDANKLPHPRYFTFEQVFQFPPHDLMYRRLRKLETGPVQGYATGWYYANTVFVNLKKAARAVMNPGCSSWSFPCYKIDREPCGVAAHETGHHVDHVLGNGHQPSLSPDLNPDSNAVRLYYTLFTGSPSSNPEWAHVVRGSKAITSYEPNLHESFAESMRLFILNPDLLYHASRPRFDFITKQGLIPSEDRCFQEVLDHPTYIAQAERWIAKEK